MMLRRWKSYPGILIVLFPLLSMLYPAHLTADAPYTTLRVHRANKLQVPVSNWGVFGVPGGPWYTLTDPISGEQLWRLTYKTPLNTLSLQFGALWVGALVNTALGYDTLVSTGYDGFIPYDDRTWLTELLPGSSQSDGEFIVRSRDPQSRYYDADAFSDEDFICVYTDTVTSQSYVHPEPDTRAPHRPLFVRVRQESYAWAAEYAEDIVIIRYWIVNLRPEELHEMWIGVLCSPFTFAHDNMTGFLSTSPIPGAGSFADTIMTAWLADNDGDPYLRRSWDDGSQTAAIGFRFLGNGVSSCQDNSMVGHSYNWWVPNEDDARLDWGPQLRPGDISSRGGYGQPIGDKQKYRFMSNEEIDYDQHLANIDHTGDGWLDAPGIRANFNGIVNYADGDENRVLLSTGPFNLAAGDSMSIGFAIFGGEYFHQDPTNGRNLSKNPETWYDHLNFYDLVLNSRWASWLYDNPGVDTDGDGCLGRKYSINCRQEDSVLVTDYCVRFKDSTVICFDTLYLDDYEVCDTIYYVGDGVPDLAGPPPPPAPAIEIAGEPYTVRITWTGETCEPFFDPFAQRRDFEGYNVYSGIGSDVNSLNLICSWDVIDYDRYRYTPTARPSPWVRTDQPFTPADLKGLYGPDFNPQDYPHKNSPYTDNNGNRLFFKPHGGNRGNEYVEGGQIVSNLIQYVSTDSTWDEDSQNWQLFGHYECVIDNLLPSQPYYFAVTAFDQGYAAGDLGPLESSPQSNLQLAYPTYSPEYVQQNRLNVSVYPNPYKIDATYRGRGYEDPNHEGFKERVRRIHFVNLPPKATIKIFSLDGDLIRELHHPESHFSDTPSHTAWDLITRNTQAITSGIYLYSIESDWGNQVGKIVVIK